MARTKRDLRDPMPMECVFMRLCFCKFARWLAHAFTSGVITVTAGGKVTVNGPWTAAGAMAPEEEAGIARSVYCNQVLVQARCYGEGQHTRTGPIKSDKTCRRASRDDCITKRWQYSSVAI